MNLDSLAALKPYLSFFHPITMWILLALAIYTLYLGVQVRRTRLAEGEPKKRADQGSIRDSASSDWLYIFSADCHGGNRWHSRNLYQQRQNCRWPSPLCRVGHSWASFYLGGASALYAKAHLGAQHSCFVKPGGAGAV